MPEVLYSQVEDEIKHYGIKGMKWGVRRSAAQLARRARGKTAEEDYSEDAKRARTAKSTAKTKGVAALSNKELKDLNERLNLEQNYKRLVTEGKNKPSAMKFVEDTVKGAKKAGEVYNLAQSDFGQAAQQQLFGKAYIGPKQKKR